MLSEIYNKRTNFWIYQILGWIGFYIMVTTRETLQIIQDKSNLSNIIEESLSYIIYVLLGFLFTILLRYIYQWFYRKQNQIIKTTGFIILMTFLVTLIHTVLVNYIYSLLIKPINTPNLIFLLIHIIWNLPVYFGWSILYFGIKYWNQSVFEKEKSEKAIFLAQTAQLQMLRYQLNPHFLFNSLNSITALIDEDKKTSKDMIAELADFLRYSLISKNYTDIPLEEELKAIRLYFSIEKKRFEEKLEVEYEIAPEAEKFPVLSLLLNPIVENAIKYGMLTSVLPLRIAIIAKIVNQHLILQVTNTGKWIDSVKNDNNNGTRTGLENIKLRLLNAYSDKPSFHIGQIDDKVIATIEIHGKS